METPAPQVLKEPGNKYWQYLFEFFMLFLAVFCGFLAENFREDQDDRQREQQYMVTLIEDLKADTAEFTRLTTMCINFRSRMDSVITYMRPPVAKDKVMQYYIESVWMSSMNSFSYNDRTTEQLKNAGAFSLIQKNNVADSIVAYDNIMRGVFSKNYNVMWDHRIKLRSMFEEIIDISAIRYARVDFPNKLVYFDDSLKTDTLSRMQIITNDNKIIMKAYNASIDQIYFSKDFSRWIKRMNTKAISLIHLIQKEYKID